MLILIAFSFIAGLVTILSPCILPVLPILLSGGLTGSKKRPFGIVIGFIFSFSFFTLLLSSLVKVTGISADNLRSISIIIIGFFGLTLILPSLQIYIEKLFTKLSSKVKVGNNNGLWGGILIGVSLGLVWTPCVGPILASVITLAATSQISLASVFITIAYSVGTAIPMVAIIFSGRKIFEKVPFLLTNTAKIQQGFGVLMVITAVGIYYNFDRQFQTYVLTTFPNYGTNLTKIEDNSFVETTLDNITNSEKALVNEDDFLLAPEIIAGGEWINSEPITIASLKGKVVLVDFWTYTCINCIRTLPYLKDWDEKYSDKGLVIIGVHTPEFEFEKDLDNVTQAVSDFGLKYPIVQDNNYATWNAYSNRYWPAKYFVDKNGRIRKTHFGEGDYAESEEFIQQLLAETGSDVSQVEINSETYDIESQSPETYLGYSRMQGFVSKERVKKDERTMYSNPTSISSNSFAYSGYFTIGSENSLPEKGSLLTFSFASKKVFLVMRPKDGTFGQVKVFLDGEEVGMTQVGKDVSESIVSVDSDRLFELINLENFGKHIIQLEFLDSNVEIFAFTFG